ncbi:nuclear transport factor 2 family protein [Actinocrispum sp. NPDC049592]|uniref:nuclear transport factor 2 family protein n=1 Tax=Actinocrispum sp. NPDC049592 TaxID=3154835 RepID=UPI00342F908B
MDGLDSAAVIRTHVDAFNRGDINALMAGFTEDARWVTGETVILGYQGLTDFFGGAITSLKPQLTIMDLLADGDRVACQLREAVSGQVFFIAGFYRVRHGRIAAAKIYREGSADL